MKHISYFGVGAFVLALSLSSVVSAQTPDNFVESAFREYLQIPASLAPIKVPTVVEVPLDGRFFEYSLFAVKDTTDKNSTRYIGNYFHRAVLVANTLIDVVSPADPSMSLMLDGSYQTFAGFDVSESGVGSVAIELVSQKPVTASALTLSLDSVVALPNTILIQADTASGQNIVVLNTTRMTGNTMRFPKTTSSHWKITLGYSQPLRITELQILDEDATRAVTQGVRFLATPGHSYEVYMNPDRAFLQNLSTTESGDLVTDKGVRRIAPIAPLTNPAYVVLDSDSDGIPDTRDNCASFANPAQEDVNQNNTGDVCEDFDRDGIMNVKDNCPNDPNIAQTDTDGDKMGDMCDGEESRITEKNAWLPWAGMGLAAIVVLVLVFVTVHSGVVPPKPEDPTPPIP